MPCARGSVKAHPDLAPACGVVVQWGIATPKGLIIMTRTTIHTSQGETFIRAGGMRILARRTLLAALIIGGAIFVSAAIIGLLQAHSANRPTAKEFAILHNAEKAGARNCRLEWNEAQNAHEVICGAGIDLDILRHLAARPAITKGAISDPNGIALIGECLSDSTLSDAELTACLNQPAN
jgi:hypothetical protein